MNKIIEYTRVLLIVVSLGVAFGTWLLLSKPVLLHTHRFALRDYRPCGGYNEQGTGITLLNPFRSREAEHVADRVFRRLANAECPTEMSADYCKSIALRNLAPRKWKIVYRTDSVNDIDLFFSWPPQRAPTGCRIIEMLLTRRDTNWKVLRYGVSW